MIFGSFASSMSMQSGAPTFGTPEPALMLYVMAALARRLGVPFRSGGALTASKIADAQAAYESANTMQPTMLGGVNFVLHTAGWLEGGLAMGYEKFILDVDQAAAWHAFAKGVDMSPNGQALDALLTNEPGVHFLGHPHTLANFEGAFWRSSNADNGSFEQWDLDGAQDANVRANATWKKMLAEYEAPPIDEAVDEELLRVHRAQEGLLPGLERLMATRAPSPRPATVAELLTRSRYEVIPLAGVEEHVLEHVPRDVTLTVTASPTKGLDHTLELAAQARGAGLSGRAASLGAPRRRPGAPRGARRADSRDGRARRLRRRRRRGRAGRARSRAPLQLLDAIAEVGHPFEQIGITGYPESHPLIDDETTIAAMFEKARHATYIASQICFDSRVTVAVGRTTSGRAARGCRS